MLWLRNVSKIQRISGLSTVARVYRADHILSWRNFFSNTRKHSTITATRMSEREILPKNVYPKLYTLRLEPDFEKFTFQGEVAIDLEVKEQSDSITLNTFELELQSVKIDGKDAADVSYNSKRQEHTFKLAAGETLNPGKDAKLVIDFTGILNDQMAGFYRSTYKNEKGETQYMGVTQFEPTDARRAFPCFDEPEIKSRFKLFMIADKKLTCLFNMLAVGESEVAGKPDKKCVEFDTTPLLSTYLVAYIVGDLRYVECNDYKIPVRVYNTPGLEKQGEFSAKLAAKTLAFFAKAFDIEYYLPHMNMVGIHDFSAGAMENLSLITYRTVDLLIDEKTASLTRKLRVAEVVQHELAHQWFGNLVTMKWWNDLWLNESYATYCSYLVFESELVNDKSFIWQNFEADTLSSALRLDSLRSSHPIEVPVKRADEINQIFDAISYSKGSSLLRMIAYWLGKDTFLKGVSNYLKEHKYSNAETSDLWRNLSAASGKDVNKVMDIWTKNVGYPVVEVLESSEDSNSVKFVQHRFLSTGDVKPEDDTTLYPVFLRVKTDAGVDDSIILDTREKTVPIDTSKFYKVNAEAVGFYRTLYTPERWAKLGSAATEGLLSVEDRTHLLDDAFTLAVSGYHSTTNFLNLVSQWTEEKEFIVWSQMSSLLSEVRSVWKFQKDDKILEALRKVSKKLISTKFKEYNDWTFNDNESVLEQRLKTTIFAGAAAVTDVKMESLGMNDEKFEKLIVDMFEKYIAGDKDSINPNIKNSVFFYIARNGGEKEYDQFLEIYKNPVSLDEKVTVLQILGSFEEPKLIERTLKYCMDSEVVKPQDIYLPLRGLRSSKAGVEALWKWFSTNYDVIKQRFPPSLSMFGNIVSLCTSSYFIDGKSGKPEIEAFFKDKDFTGFRSNYDQALETLDSKASWLERDAKEVEEWLVKNKFL